MRWGCGIDHYAGSRAVCQADWFWDRYKSAKQDPTLMAISRMLTHYNQTPAGRAIFSEIANALAERLEIRGASQLDAAKQHGLQACIAKKKVARLSLRAVRRHPISDDVWQRPVLAAPPPSSRCRLCPAHRCAMKYFDAAMFSANGFPGVEDDGPGTPHRTALLIWALPDALLPPPPRKDLATPIASRAMVRS